MNAEEAERYLRSLDVLGENYGLERIEALLVGLGNPHRAAPAIHVVGSNGKTSTARFAAAALRSAGRRVGLYVSPHVTGWHERIEIDGRPVDPAAFGAALARVKGVAEDLAEPATQFEVLTAAAFTLLADGRVDVMVVEAGLGGRFDATNVFEDSVVALTRVDLEHTELLGDTLTEIAGEKLAVVTAGSRLLACGPLHPDVGTAAAARATSMNVPLLRHGDDFGWSDGSEGVTITTPQGHYEGLKLSARGEFQRDNLALALVAAEGILDAPVLPQPLRQELVRLTIPGRFEIAGSGPAIVVDGAHNPAGAAALGAALRRDFADARIVAVLGALETKDLEGVVAELAPLMAGAVATTWLHPRARSAEDVGAALGQAGVEVQIEPSPEIALGEARRLAGTDGVVLVTGSLYLIEEYRRCELLPVG